MCRALYDEATGVPTAEHPTILYADFKDALAPLGTFGSGKARVGLVLKRGAFNDDYKFFDPDHPDIPGAISAGSDSMSALGWVDTTNRLLDEMNDKNNPSRSGDIVLLMDTSNGVIAVNEDDILPGWHGGPTGAESRVPMIWSYKGAIGPDALHRSGLISDVIELNADPGDHGGTLRTLHFKQILHDILDNVKRTLF